MDHISACETFVFNVRMNLSTCEVICMMCTVRYMPEA